MKKLALVSAISLAASGQAMAAAYKLPESSINATALSAAYVANAHGADASYYNPAAMVFSEEQRASIEADLTLVHLTSINLTSTNLGTDATKTENIPVPTFHYISPAMDNMRFGLSVVAPGGLSKRWKGIGKTFAEEFTLETIELNPTISFKVNDRFSIGGGLRAIFSSGVVKSSDQGVIPVISPSRDLKGDSWDFGYNLAFHFEPTEQLKLSATYRSKVDLTVEGNATLSDTVALPTIYTPASVEIPIPASLSLAAAYDVTPDTTMELVLERTYWSAYKELDFEYPASVGGYTALFDNPSAKNWKDSNTIRIGVTHQVNPKLTMMAGFAYDETPVPEAYAGFELPDSDAKIFSVGARYNYSDDLSIGAALLYDQKKKLAIDAGESTNPFLSGGSQTFEDARAYLLTVGLEYKF
ncbi:OmpP1/FadL family transporter [Sedimenticola hydrogenitrophicus]|uniref:OmpP1/FadL family transporter n=1 Tax=Sedimenticola hydrogenitrophicus TaxID=2967975 RepID=UPI0021A53B6E|nr:OmpP1/FadL family transporter [Sedimenticola hydrogenitrophicus]